MHSGPIARLSWLLSCCSARRERKPIGITPLSQTRDMFGNNALHCAAESTVCHVWDLPKPVSCRMDTPLEMPSQAPQIHGVHELWLERA